MLLALCVELARGEDGDGDIIKYYSKLCTEKNQRGGEILFLSEYAC